jgi:PAS domain S-box-containing protein
MDQRDPVLDDRRDPSDSARIQLATLERLLALPATSLWEALDAAAQIVSDLFRAEKVDAWLHAPEVGGLRVAGISDSPLSKTEVALGLDRLRLADGGPIAEVFRTGRPFLTGRAEREQIAPDVDHKLGVRSMMCQPLHAGGERRGVLLVSSTQPQRYTEGDLDFLGAVARWVGLAADRVESAEHAARHAAEAAAAQRLRRLQAVTEATLAPLALDDLLRVLVGRVREVLVADTAAVLFLEDDSLLVRAAAGEEELEQGMRLPFGRGFCGRIAAERRVLSLEDVEQDDILSPLLREKAVKSMLGAPLLVDGRVLGTMHVGTLARRRWSADDAELLQLMADRVAMALERARLYEAERSARAGVEALAAALAAERDRLQLEVAERQRAEQALRESAERLRLALAAAGMGTWDWDLRTDAQLISPEAEALFGFAPGTYHGAHEQFYAAIHADDRARVRKATEAALGTGTLEVEHRVVWPDGSVHWVAGAGRVHRDAAGQPARMLGVVIDVTERKRAEVERARLTSALAERERQLQELVGRLILAQEEERRRIAYELHDGVAQTAAGAHLHLRGFARRHLPERPEVRQELEQAVELAQRAVREVRTVVGELRPTALDDLGLEEALRAEVDELRKDGLQVELTADLGPERLAPEVETTLFRVAQEALRNVRKHACATRACVRLRRTRRAVTLEVRDWGRGFRPSSAQAGAGPGERVGLLGMRERVGLLGGRCEVRSRPGAGTRILAEVPLPTLVH